MAKKWPFYQFNSTILTTDNAKLPKLKNIEHFKKHDIYAIYKYLCTSVMTKSTKELNCLILSFWTKAILNELFYPKVPIFNSYNLTLLPPLKAKCDQTHPCLKDQFETFHKGMFTPKHHVETFLIKSPILNTSLKTARKPHHNRIFKPFL